MLFFFPLHVLLFLLGAAKSGRFDGVILTTNLDILLSKIETNAALVQAPSVVADVELKGVYLPTSLPFQHKKVKLLCD